jgi:MATE family multidrug resistance protein
MRMNPTASALRQQVAESLRPGSERASLRGDVLRLALPATAEQMLAMMVGIVDTYLVGHLGAASLAAVGLAAQWTMLAATVFGSIATGSTALIARFVGAREEDQANQVVRQSVLLGLLVGAATTLLGVSLSQPALRLLGAQSDVVLMGSSYLRLVSCVFLFSTLTFLGNACLRGAGDTRTPMAVMAVVNVVNIAVAWTFINGRFGFPRLGVVGSALGAASGATVGGILVTATLLRGRGILRLRLDRLRFDWGLIRRILNVGLPTGVEQLFFRAGFMVFARILAGLGTVAYAANQVAINGWSLSFMPGFGFAVAATTLVGQSLGAGRSDLAERRGYTTYWMGALIMTAMGLAFLFFPRQIVAFFTNDAQVIALATGPLRMVGWIQPISAAAMIFSGALRGAGDTRYPMVATILAIWVVRLPLAYVLAHTFGWGLAGAWVAMAVDGAVRAVLNYLRFRGGRWKMVQV